MNTAPSNSSASDVKPGRTQARPNRRWRWAVLAVLALVAIAAISLAFFAHGVRVSLDAECTLHAYYLVSDVTLEYCKEHGTWPQSWDDLSTIQPSRRPAVWQWPADVSEIRHRVSVDFSLTSEDFETMNAENFRAINQRVPCFPLYDDEIDQFIVDVRQALADSKVEDSGQPAE